MSTLEMKCKICGKIKSHSNQDIGNILTIFNYLKPDEIKTYSARDENDITIHQIEYTCIDCRKN